ncbi:MAG: peptidase C45 acyl-coenzyme A:6-aminopenicillanic acid acyl-transferase [Planctomycetaceae bacterium]|nr:peptidase C45 acyl-coenzyme A:6-aminopenicillanic acid acyl-transferase [Planctomycetales bacterium]MCB9922531.1 peptidase C45 acyl-coenzyme A:6-aminopenicillanic acid acyl-transferase [Planctomycetaceae bacterium]
MSRSITRRVLLGTCLTLLLFQSYAGGADDNQVQLARELKPLLECLGGKRDKFTLSAEVEFKIDGNLQKVNAQLASLSDDSFDLDITHQDYAIQIRRRSEATAMVLPLHKTVFLGRGESNPDDHLTPTGIATRLISPASNASTYLPILQSGDPNTVALILIGLIRLQLDPDTSSWKLGDKLSIRFADDGNTLDARSDDARVLLSISEAESSTEPLGNWPGFHVVDLNRGELERQLVRGVRRALEILDPAGRLISPPQTSKQVEHGELRWIDGQRVAILYGTPEQIGKAHGELLKQEAMRCIDSVLYSFGTVQTIRTGRWFRHDLADAYARLAPHIPARHKAETRAMAASLGLEEELCQTLNVFPELFHCSGFAVFGKATVDGKLYHGRVLDYMTTIGLQDAATTFIVAPDGHNAFANVGYAGFIGSVSGMNAQGVSLGEMGGRGEGQWDGVPMATLMRRALEECSTLEDVTDLWASNPRTCEYYYVFADGKTNEAVGVAATPDSIQFVHPGEAHELLGAGIADAVVLSAGSRLAKLRERVQQRYGQIDADVAQWLMSRPVAMESNLHNVLFIPGDRLLYVANASHNKPAAERPYVRLDLKELLDAIPGSSVEDTVAVTNN